MAVKFVKRDRDHAGYSPRNPKPHFREVTRHGKTFSLNGDEVELFMLGVLAEALDRKPAVILTWEKKGLFPKPLFAVKGSRCKRWYSKEQIVNLHRVMMYRWQGKKYIQNKETHQLFLDELKKVFYERDVVVGPDGQITE